MSTEHPIDPALLDQPVTGGRGTKRKARGSESVAVPESGVGSIRASTRLAGKGSNVVGGSGVSGGVIDAGQKTAGEPSRGEEENLIGSEYKLRGKRPRGGKGKSKSASKSPVKKRSSLPSNEGKGKGKEKQEGQVVQDGNGNDMADSSVINVKPTIPLLYKLPYPIALRPFRYPCLKPNHDPPPPGDPSKAFKRFDPHEFDDPKSLLDADSLSSDEEEDDDPVKGEHAEKVEGREEEPVGGGYNDGPFGMGGEMDYDTQAYQSLAALLEASNDDLFQSNEGNQ